MQKKALVYLLLIMLINSFVSIISATPRFTLTNNDPNPLFDTIFPYSYLYTNDKEFLKGHTNVLEKQYFYLSFSPFFQTASKGTNSNNRLAELGDLTGRWNMIAILPYNQMQTNINDGPELVNTGIDIPSPLSCQQERGLSCIMTADTPASSVAILSGIRDNMLKCIANVFTDTTTGARLPYPNELKSVQGLLDLQKNTPELLGFFAVPIKYRKYGIRFKAQAMIFKDLGAQVELGVSQISQVARFIDLTTTPTACFPSDCTSTCPSNVNPAVNCANPFPSDLSDSPFPQGQVTDPQWQAVVGCIHRELMQHFSTIAKATGINLCNYHKTSIEDFRAELFWRHAFCINVGRDREWPRFLFIPFASFGVNLGIGKEADPDVILSLPAGNNGHNAFDFLAGCSLDFTDTIEIGGEAGFTHFRPKTFDCWRVPTNCAQNAFYPYKTAVCIDPGNTWHVGLYMNSYHFIDHVSFWAEYLFITHDKDQINLIAPAPSQFCHDNPDKCKESVDTPFVPGELECKSQWMSQFINAALNYDASPNFTIGVAVQIPISRKNAYRSSTFMATLNIAY